MASSGDGPPPPPPPPPKAPPPPTSGISHPDGNSDAATSKAAGDEILIQVKAWGYEDPNRTGYIKAGKETVVTLSQSADGNETRGLHLATFTTSSGGFKVDQAKRFDVWKNKTQAADCVNFIQSLRPGTIVAGASADEISKNIAGCKDALASLGIPTQDITYRGSVAFVACVGDIDWTVYKTASRHEGPVTVSKLVAVKDGIMSEGRLAHIQGWGFEDKKRTGYIKLNGRTIVDLSQSIDSNVHKGLHLVVIEKKAEYDFETPTIERFHLSQEEPQEVARLQEFLEKIRNESIVLGASAEDIVDTPSFDHVVKVLQEHLHLEGLEKLRQNSSIAFIAKKGNPSYGKLKTARMLRGPVSLSMPLIDSQSKVKSGKNPLSSLTMDELLTQKSRLRSRNKKEAKVYLDRDKLFDQFDVDDRYPIEKIKDLFTLDSGVVHRIDLTGVEQLNDLFFWAMKFTHKADAFARNLTNVSVQSCVNLTDQGIKWMAETFPLLSSVNISGCRNLTAASVTHLMSHCQEIETIIMRTTNVGVIHFNESERLCAFKTQGCPLIAPGPVDFANEDGSDSKQAPNLQARNVYFKEIKRIPSFDIFKGVIVHIGKDSPSILEYISASGKSLPARKGMASKSNVDFESCKFSFVECSLDTIDLFFSDRTLYVIVFNETMGFKFPGEVARTIAHIFAKVPTAVIHVVTTGNADAKFAEDSVKEKLTIYSKSMAKESAHLTTEMYISQEPMSFAQQQSAATLNAQAELMKMITLEPEKATLQLTFGEPIKANDKQSHASLMNAINESAEKIHQLHPWYQYLPKDAVDKLSTFPCEQGVLSESHFIQKWMKEQIKPNEYYEHYRKYLEMLHKLGRVVYLPKRDSGRIGSGLVLSDIDGFLASFNKITADADKLTNGSTHKFLERNALLTEVLNFANKEGWNELMHSTDMFLKLDNTHAIQAEDLPSELPVPMDHFHDLEMNDNIQMIAYKFNMPVKLPDSLVKKILVHFAKIETPALISNDAVLIHEAPTTVYLKFERNATFASRGTDGYEGSSFVLMTQMLSARDADTNANLLKILWSQIEMYSYPVAYMLSKNNIHHYLRVLVNGEVVKEKSIEKVVPLPGNHSPKEPSDKVCKECGMQLESIVQLKNDRNYVMPVFASLCPLRVVEDKVQVKGNWYNTKPSQTDMHMKLPNKLNNLGMSQFSIIPLVGKDLEVLLNWRGETSCSLQVLLGPGKIQIDDGDGEAMKTEVFDNGVTIQRGSVFTTRVTILNSDAKKQELDLLRNGQCVFSKIIPNVDVTISVITTTQTTFQMETGLALGKGSGLATWTKGMRLEAVDRLNPSLVCTASVADVRDETGEVLIHFDGWTSKYDYWSKSDDKGLHPIGYMLARAKHHPNLNPRLQEPKGYGSRFTWDSYLIEVNSPNVPYELFTDEQIEDTPKYALKAETEQHIAANFEHSLGYPACKSSRKRIQTIRKEIRMNIDDIVTDFLKEDTSESALGVILPARMTEQILDYPSSKVLRNWDELKIYYMCLGNSNRMSDMHLVDGPGATIHGKVFDIIKKCGPLMMVLHMTVAERATFIPKTVTRMVHGVQNWPTEKIQVSIRNILTVMSDAFFLVAQENPLTEVEDDVEEMAELYKNMWEEAVDGEDIAATFVKRESDEEAEIKKYGKKLFDYICLAHSNCDQNGRNATKFDLDEFGNYSNLVTTLNFSDNLFQTLPDQFFPFFPDLQYLDLSNNKLTALPLGIGHCKRFKGLNVSDNNLSELPADFADIASTLVSLDFSRNPIKDIPNQVFSCTNLEALKANHVILTSLDGSISNLTKLKKLELAGSSLTSLPGSMSSLTELEALDVSGVPWIEAQGILSKGAYAEYINTYPAMREISKQEIDLMFSRADEEDQGTLDSPGIQSLNAQIFQTFNRFGQENLASEPGGVPLVIYALTKLKKLNLSYQGLKLLHVDIQSLENLSELNLAHNPQLESLCGELSLLKKMTVLPLRGCPSLKTPPKEIVARGFSAVFGYLRRLQLGSVECKKTKLMMVGLGGAGKTSLVNAMCKGAYTYYGDPGHKITDGIDITKWDVGQGKEQVTFSVWDFAGQAVYYNTHQFFLSNRAVYLLMWNIRLGYEHAGLEFWLSSIACHAPKAPIMVIGTHFDQVKKYWIPKEELMRRYPQIVAFHAVSAYDGQNVPELKANLHEVALKEKYMGERIPEAYLSLEKAMIRKRDKKINTIEWSELEDVAVECGIYEQQEMTQAIGFLHDLGSVQHFQNEHLKKKVVISPQWIVDAMSCVVSVQNTPIHEGKLKHEDLPKIWAKFTDAERSWLLRLTEKFDLTFPVKDEPANIVPCLLPDDEPEYNWPDVDTIPGYRENKMVYKFDYLPAGLFNRAQVRLHQFSDGAVLWKKGSLLRKNGHLALMTQEKNQQMTVRVQGPRPENILFMVHEVYEGLIQESFHGVTYDYFVPCQDCLKTGTHDPCMFPHSRIRRATELKAPFLQCDKNFHTLPLSELHALTPPDTSKDFDVHLERSLRDLKDLKDDLTYDVFMVYAAADIPKNGEEETKIAPRKIRDDLELNGLKVWFPMDPAQIIIEQVAVTMKEAKVVMMCISDNFVEDEHYCKIFFYAKNNLQKEIQLVILGKSWDWKQSELGMHVSTDVFVNMMDPKRYQHKIKELIETVKNKSHVGGDDGIKEVKPPCFISYCWTNSADAIKKGSRRQDGALGWGDPREFKEFFESNNIPCWIDIERVGQGSLFEDIAKGLKHAKVMVCCVSDEYARSRNCQMEFRFAAVALKIPMVVAIVGTGYQWEATEIGMLSLGSPKMNFQYENPSGHQRLLDAVREFIPEGSDFTAESIPGTPVMPQDNKEMAFQELLELAERKFLRQISTYADETDNSPYPRLFILDFLTEAEILDMATAHLDALNKLREEERLKAEEAKKKEREEDLAEHVRQELKARREAAEDKQAQGDGITEVFDETNKQLVNEIKEQYILRNIKKHDEAPEINVEQVADVVAAMRPVTARSRPGSAQGTLGDLTERKRPGLRRKMTSQLPGATSGQLGHAIELASIVKNWEQEHCLRILCEHEEGWHYHGGFIPLDPMSKTEWNDWLVEISPYMARLMAILRHTNLDLPILTTVMGDEIRRFLEDACGIDSEFKTVYIAARKQMMAADKKRVMGTLRRCILASGKMVWMCPKHIALDGSVTVLENDALDVSEITLQEEALMADKLKASSLEGKRPKTSSKTEKPENDKAKHGDVAKSSDKPAPVNDKKASESAEMSSADTAETAQSGAKDVSSPTPSGTSQSNKKGGKKALSSAESTRKQTTERVDTLIKTRGKLKGAAAAAEMAANNNSGSKACSLM